MILLKDISVHPSQMIDVSGRPYYCFIGNSNNEVILCSSAKFVDTKNDICIICTESEIYFTRHVCKIKTSEDLKPMRELIYNTFGRRVLSYQTAVEWGVALD